MYVIPKKGFTVRDPQTKRALPAEGKEVPNTFYWVRRLRDGDVTIGTPPVKSAAPVAAAKDVVPEDAEAAERAEA
ncbi:MAG TPA: DUF2635 domain-containing protein [Rhodopila sp.]|jgi:hypothetical protein|nr:DUF2635 domain-containing protein [Rhodopila sp.]